jgi:hypothetical protein
VRHSVYSSSSRLATDRAKPKGWCIWHAFFMPCPSLFSYHSHCQGAKQYSGSNYIRDNNHILRFLWFIIVNYLHCNTMGFTRYHYKPTLWAMMKSHGVNKVCTIRILGIHQTAKQCYFKEVGCLLGCSTM